MSKPIPERTYIDIGLQYGLIKPDWLLEQYLVDAATREDGYETVAVQGVQGSGKSSRAMHMVSWIKENELREKLGRDPTDQELWESVLDCIIIKPSDFCFRVIINADFSHYSVAGRTCKFFIFNYCLRQPSSYEQYPITEALHIFLIIGVELMRWQDAACQHCD